MNTWPGLFLGHGSPMNAIRDSPFASAWEELGRALGKPRAVLCLSAHWLTRGTFLTGNARPRTIHDFGGFPPALYEVHYPAPGDPALAEKTAALLGLGSVAVTDEWGLDHGAWSVLRRLYPAADVPVVQMSLDVGLSAAGHWALAERLAPLREDDVLVLASGNVVHNVGDISIEAEASVPPWARDFDEAVAQALRGHDKEALIAWESLTPQARRAHPTPDHFWPLLYTAALRRPGDALTFPVDGFQHGTIAMRAARAG